MARKNNEVIGEFVAELLKLPVGEVFQYQDKVFWATKKRGIYITTMAEWKKAVEIAMGTEPDTDAKILIGGTATKDELFYLMQELYNTINETVFLGEIKEDD